MANSSDASKLSATWEGKIVNETLRIPSTSQREIEGGEFTRCPNSVDSGSRTELGKARLIESCCQRFFASHWDDEKTQFQESLIPRGAASLEDILEMTRVREAGTLCLRLNREIFRRSA